MFQPDPQGGTSPGIVPSMFHPYLFSFPRESIQTLNTLKSCIMGMEMAPVEDLFPHPCSRADDIQMSLTDSPLTVSEVFCLSSDNAFVATQVYEPLSLTDTLSMESTETFLEFEISIRPSALNIIPSFVHENWTSFPSFALHMKAADSPSRMISKGMGSSRTCS